MASKYLIDTNAVIDYLNNKLPEKAADLLDSQELELSVISRMELLAWPKASPKQLSVLKEFIGAIVIWSLDEPVIVKGIEIRKDFRVKLPDAIIAATAIVHGLALITRNVDDFKKITGLELINPWNAK